MRFLERLCFGLAMAAGLVGLLMVGLTMVDIVGRSLRLFSARGTYQLMQLAMACLIFGALPYVTMRGGHLHMSIVEAIHRRWARRVVPPLMNFASAVTSGFLALQLYKYAQKRAAFGETIGALPIPTAPFVFFMSAMAAAMAIAFLLLVAFPPGGDGKDHGGGDERQSP